MSLVPSHGPHPHPHPEERQPARARSHAHARRPWRAGLHVIFVGIAALAALITAGFVSDSDAWDVTTIPSPPLSGVRAIASTGEGFLRPAVSIETSESPLRGTSSDDRVALRPTEGLAGADTVSEAMGEAAAGGSDIGCGQNALTDRIDPQIPVVLYTVRPGDTLLEIAESCGTTIDTILINNAEVSDGDFIPVGEQVLIPFDTGIIYKVGQGETLAEIIEDYLYVTVEDVLAYRPNNLADASAIAPGKYVLLPGAEPKPPPIVTPEGRPIADRPPPVSPGRFGLPLGAWSFVSDEYGVDRGGGRIHGGIDLALSGELSGSPVYASCDGWVSRVEWLTYSYGYYVMVDCGEGWETLYAHFSEILVSWGQTVTKGQTILGITGSTGFSTGEHLHFEVRYNGVTLNPRDYITFLY